MSTQTVTKFPGKWQNLNIFLDLKRGIDGGDKELESPGGEYSVVG
jgi:hypothetical protein